MPASADLAALFPKPEDVPVPHRLDGPVVQDAYLCGGALKRWSGPYEDVVSPVWEPGPDGPRPRVIGRTPSLGGDEAREVLDAAVKAWDLGRGEWPTMPVVERLRGLEELTRRMRAARGEVVKLLMWEIGKSLPDSVLTRWRTPPTLMIANRRALYAGRRTTRSGRGGARDR